MRQPSLGIAGLVGTNESGSEDASLLQGSGASSATVHISVLLAAVIDGLAPVADTRVIDATLGGGGHSEQLLARGARVLGIDADPAARQRAATRLASAVASGRFVIAAGNFRDIGAIALAHSWEPVMGILMDLGLSSDQLADRDRGFAFSADAPLDMRFDPTTGVSAAEILATASEEEIADILWRYGEERRSRVIARRIVAARATGGMTRTTQLANLVARAIPGRPGGVHPATRTFQALRIAVNGELTALEAALPQTLDLLAPGGRLAVISFHSLEDRIVKHWMRAEERGCICPPATPVCVCGHAPRLRVLTHHPLEADAAEIAANPRARSAKLRVAERINEGQG